MEVNEKCDVYSFGVLALEIHFGEHPRDFITSLLSSSGVMHSKLDIPLLMGKLDQRLLHPTNSVAQEIGLILWIANACLTENPHSRPTMRQVAKELLLIKEFVDLSLDIPQTSGRHINEDPKSCNKEKAKLINEPNECSKKALLPRR
ncbi:hypothetical protein Fmac_011443 [Flemingia macrophylla]|uniref:non-specific serine/threonine protein kinase n=1 Tax=Flemingia macrophylla TaxID=520843 RepID=A0ABD1MMH5_9FABA